MLRYADLQVLEKQNLLYNVRFPGSAHETHNAAALFTDQILS